MDSIGPVPAAGIPPAAPPPPPTAFGTAKVLGPGRGSPAHREHIGRLPAAKTPERQIPFAGVHPETLQHAAARLRPTQHRESLLSHEREQFLDGPDQLAVGRHWTYQPEHGPMAVNQTGAKVHAAPDDSQQFAPVCVHSGYSHSLNNQPTANAPHQYYKQKSQRQQEQQQPNTTYHHQQQQQQPIAREVPIQLIGPQPGQRFDPSPAPPSPSIQLITEPKRYIHAYATQTPAATLLDEAERAAAAATATMAHNNGTTTNRGEVNNAFARQLRDQGLTERQRAANQRRSPQNLGGPRDVPGSLHNYAYHQTISSSASSANQPHQPTSSTDQQVDQLIREMEQKMRSSHPAGYGTPPLGQDYCTKCRQQISGDPPGVTALGQAYHVTCFCCDQCQKQLAGCSFYAVDGKNLCQVDYMNSLEKCEKCKMPITQKILRALSKAFHPECFSCPSCQKSLDGIPFTVDKENQAYCLDCYHERFSPRCAACLKVIAPNGTETEVARVIAMDRSYHLDCYKCEDCGLKLNSKIEGQGCYPLESHLFCKNCNLKRLKTLK